MVMHETREVQRRRSQKRVVSMDEMDVRLRHEDFEHQRPRLKSSKLTSSSLVRRSLQSGVDREEQRVRHGRRSKAVAAASLIAIHMVEANNFGSLSKRDDEEEPLSRRFELKRRRRDLTQGEDEPLNEDNELMDVKNDNEDDKGLRSANKAEMSSIEEESMTYPKSIPVKRLRSHKRRNTRSDDDDEYRKKEEMRARSWDDMLRSLNTRETNFVCLKCNNAFFGHWNELKTHTCKFGNNVFKLECNMDFAKDSSKDISNGIIDTESKEKWLCWLRDALHKVKASSLNFLDARLYSDCQDDDANCLESSNWPTMDSSVFAWQSLSLSSEIGLSLTYVFSRFSLDQQLVFHQALSKAFRMTGNKESILVTRKESKRGELWRALKLRQTNRSIKYMNRSHRRQHQIHENVVVKDDFESNKKFKCVFRGDWVESHSFLCSACGVDFPEIKQVLHHKWDKHPNCLVAHIIWKRKAATSTPQIYPQVYKPILDSLSSHQLVSDSVSCSKCGQRSFETRDRFHTHLFVCGNKEANNETDKDGNNEKRKKRVRNSLQATSSSSPQKREEERARRLERVARFSRPPPAPSPDARLTRRRAKLNDKEDNKRVRTRSRKTKTATKDKDKLNSVNSSLTRRARRCSSLWLASESSSRIFFPPEVKAEAVERIERGESQVVVARDLQCPVSTVASWWKKKRNGNVDHEVNTENKHSEKSKEELEEEVDDEENNDNRDGDNGVLKAEVVDSSFEEGDLKNRDNADQKNCAMKTNSTSKCGVILREMRERIQRDLEYSEKSWQSDKSMASLLSNEVFQQSVESEGLMSSSSSTSLGLSMIRANYVDDDYEDEDNS